MASEIHASHNSSRRSPTSRLMHTAQKETRPAQKFFQKFGNDWSMTFAGSLAYSLLTAMLPIAIAIVALLGFILGGQSNSQHILQQIQSAIPGLKSQGSLLQSVSNQLQRSAGILALLSIILAIVGGSRLFVAIEGCMAIIYRVRPRAVLRQNLVAIGMMVLFIFLTPLMVFASTLPGFLVGFVGNNPSLRSVPFLDAIAKNALTVNLAAFIGGLIVAFVLFEAIYFIVPNQKVSWRNSWIGALVAAFALELFLTIIFPFYAANFLKNYVGQIGFAVVLLVFFYYFAVILILGAEINAYFREKVQPLPNDLATFVSTMGGRLNNDIPDAESTTHKDAKPTEHADDTHITEESQNKH